MKVNERIKELREKQNLSQENVADLINETQSGYSKIELGKKKLKVETLIKLTKVFNTTSDYILGIKKENEQTNKIEKIIEYCQKIKTEN